MSQVNLEGWKQRKDCTIFKLNFQTIHSIARVVMHYTLLLINNTHVSLEFESDRYRYAISSFQTTIGAE